MANLAGELEIDCPLFTGRFIQPTNAGEVAFRMNLVKSIIVCEHTKEVLLAYRAPIFRGDWVYWYGCVECGRVRKFTHRQAQSDRARNQALIAKGEEQAMEALNPFGKDD